MLEQRNDSSLASYWQRANRGSNEFVVKNEIMFRRNHNSTGCHEFQLVLPESYRDEIMALGHDQQLSGHCGARRMLSHISDGFFFPKMWLRVKSYVRSCHVCQMTRALNKNEVPAPLQTTEVMQDAAFSHLQIDILGGDLPRSRSGYKYLLTIVCVNSRSEMD